MQLASAYGMKVLGTAGSSEGEEAVKQAGASLVFNHRKDGYVQMILVGFTSYGCTNINLLITEREGRTGEYWPEVVALRAERTKTTEGPYIPQYGPEQVRSISCLL